MYTCELLHPYAVTSDYNYLLSFRIIPNAVLCVECNYGYIDKIAFDQHRNGGICNLQKQKTNRKKEIYSPCLQQSRNHLVWMIRNKIDASWYKKLNERDIVKNLTSTIKSDE